jgi:hypothetical protein
MTHVRHPFVERCRLWALLADALDGHPRRDELFQAIGDLDALYAAEQDALALTVQTNAYAEGFDEREQLRAQVADRDRQLEQLYTVISSPTAGIMRSMRH